MCGCHVASIQVHRKRFFFAMCGWLLWQDSSFPLLSMSCAVTAGWGVVRFAHEGCWKAHVGRLTMPLCHGLEAVLSTEGLLRHENSLCTKTIAYMR